MNLKQIKDDDSLIVAQEAAEKVRFQFYWLAEEVERLRGVLANDILSVCEDCVELGMDADLLAAAIATTVGKALEPAPPKAG